MHVIVTGKQIDVGDALRDHAEAALTDVAGKYFGNAIEAHVVFSRERHLVHCDLKVHIGRGMLVRSEGEASDAYAAFEGAGARIEKRLRRYKRRLRDHHADAKERAREASAARTYVLQPQDEESADGAAAQPVVIAEMETPILELSVSEAVMRLDLGELPALLFRNSAHGTFNVVYRRRDGNIGWIDPDLPDRRRTSS